MASVMFSPRATAADVLASVSSAAHLVTASINSVAALAQTAEANAIAYRDDALFAIQVERKQTRTMVLEEAKIRTTTRMIAINKQLADPEFKAVYDSLSAAWSDA